MVLDASEMEDKTRIKKILIMAPNWIGDAVLALPAISRIRKSFPFARIAIIGHPHISELFQENPSVDEIRVYKGGLLTTIRDIRKSGFDLAILLPNSFRTALIGRLTGVPFRCGYNRDGRGFLLNMPIRLNPEVKRAHQTEYYLNLVNTLEAYFSNETMAPPDVTQWLHISKDEVQTAIRTLNENHINPDNLIIGINPGAAYGSSKRWFPERFGHVIRSLHERYNAKAIVFGSPAEATIAEEIVSAAEGHLLNMAGRTSVRELMALISCCRLFVTNDSGPMHIAAALGVPVVAIFGSTDPKLTGPVGAVHIVVRKDVACAPCFLRKCPTDLKCMDAIHVEDVMEGVEKILKASKG